MSRRKWTLHWCLLDKECRMYDAPPRVYVGTPWGFLMVAVPPLYRTLDLNSVDGEIQGVPVLTGAKTWAWEWPRWRSK